MQKMVFGFVLLVMVLWLAAGCGGGSNTVASGSDDPLIPADRIVVDTSGSGGSWGVVTHAVIRISNTSSQKMVGMTMAIADNSVEDDSYVITIGSASLVQTVVTTGGTFPGMRFVKGSAILMQNGVQTPIDDGIAAGGTRICDLPANSFVEIRFDLEPGGGGSTLIPKEKLVIDEPTLTGSYEAGWQAKIIIRNTSSDRWMNKLRVAIFDIDLDDSSYSVVASSPDVDGQVATIGEIVPGTKYVPGSAKLNFNDMLTPIDDAIATQDGYVIIDLSAGRQVEITLEFRR